MPAAFGVASNVAVNDPFWELNPVFAHVVALT
jgi:hypothetical protein